MRMVIFAAIILVKLEDKAVFVNISFVHGVIYILNQKK